MKTKTCSVAGCDKPIKARGWCSGHYSKWQRNGDPELTHPSRLRTGANRSNKSTGIRNATKIKTGFAVSIQKQGKTTHHVGAYKTIEEASVEAEKARRKLFGEYAGRGIGSRGVKAPEADDDRHV